VNVSDPETPLPPTSGEAAPHLAAIERWAILFGASLVGTTLFWGSPRVQLGACVGATLSILNARSLRFFGSRLSKFGGTSSVALLVTLFQLKLGVLAVLLYLALKLLPIQPIALVLGLSVLPLAIVARGIQYGLQTSAPVSPHSDSYTEN
jgi:hypothetical protein